MKHALTNPYNNSSGLSDPSKKKRLDIFRDLDHFTLCVCVWFCVRRAVVGGGKDNQCQFKKPKMHNIG